jgi:subfamily B ATP-binding cassette protein MsbA
MKNYWKLLSFLKPYLWPQFTFAMVCMVGYSATSGATPFLVQTMFDDVFALKDHTMLTFLPAIIVGVFVFRGLMSFGESYLMSYIGGRIVTDIRNMLHGHILSLPLSFLDRHPTGSLISRMTNDVGLVASTVGGTVPSLLRDGMSLIALSVAAFAMDPFLALIAFVVFPAAVLPIFAISKKIRNLTRKGQVKMGTLTTLMQETIQGARIVKAFGMEKLEWERFQNENEKLFRLSLRVSRNRAVTRPAMELLAAFAIGGVVWYGGYSVIGGSRTQGQFMAFLTAMFMLYKPFKQLSGTNTLVQQGIVGAERVFEIMEAKSDIQEKPYALLAPTIRQSIEFQDVWFSYGRSTVLKQVNLRINTGEVIALVGVSGVGKSTLVDLIPRFYDVTSGKITIDEEDIRDLTIESLRSQVGIVSQHTFLFNDTVKNNISYGDRTKDTESIIAAAKAANAHEFVMAMPDGYDTVIGEMGLRVSGGERQRLAIARALLKDPPILILDEATSALDSKSETLVQQALERLMVGRTVIIIAHRLSTIRKANRILVLANGTITEEGTHEELLAKKAEYSKLYTLQVLDAQDPKREVLLH